VLDVEKGAMQAAFPTEERDPVLRIKGRAFAKKKGHPGGGLSK